MLQEAFSKPGRGKKNQVYVFDKHKELTFQTSPENVLHERDFNTFEQNGMVYCLEDRMAEVEDRTAPLLRNIRSECSLAGLSESERAELVRFTALQHMRGVAVRARLLDITEQIRDLVRNEGQDPDLIPQLRNSTDPQQIKLSALAQIESDLGTVCASFANKTMLLVTAASDTAFLLGDTPVVLHNHNDTWPYGNLGLEVKGIEIYMPVSPSLALAFWCPSIIDVMETAVGQCELSIRQMSADALFGVGPWADKSREMRKILDDQKFRLNSILSAVRSKMPVASDSENMKYYNSLQVIHAERYVLSSTNDFSFVRRMLADRDKYRSGSRWELG